MENKTNNLEDGFQTAADRAYDIISAKILNGEYTPGSKLTRRKMAQATGVSVIPVIEALNRLEADGLVESKPQWGSFVITPTLERIKDNYILREAIECQVVRILSQKITSEQERELRRIANKIDNIEYSTSTSEEFYQVHYELHSKMVKYTESESLINSLRKINLFRILCKAASVRRERSALSSNWHTRIIDAIMTGDPDKAEAVMRAHILDSFNAIEAKSLEGESI